MSALSPWRPLHFMGARRHQDLISSDKESGTSVGPATINPDGTGYTRLDANTSTDLNLG
jgi:hypothetical protein